MNRASVYLVAFGTLSACAKAPPTDSSPGLPDAGTAKACATELPLGFSPSEPKGPLALELGVVDEEHDRGFIALGDGCSLQVVRTFQGNQYAIPTVRFPRNGLEKTGAEIPTVSLKLSMTALPQADAGATATPQTATVTLKLQPQCKDEYYCTISPVLVEVSEVIGSTPAQDAGPSAWRLPLLVPALVQVELRSEAGALLSQTRTWLKLIRPER